MMTVYKYLHQILNKWGVEKPKVRRLLSSCGLGVIPLTLLTLRAGWSLMVFSA